MCSKHKQTKKGKWKKWSYARRKLEREEHVVTINFQSCTSDQLPSLASLLIRVLSLIGMLIMARWRTRVERRRSYRNETKRLVTVGSRRLTMRVRLHRALRCSLEQWQQGEKESERRKKNIFFVNHSMLMMCACAHGTEATKDYKTSKCKWAFRSYSLSIGWERRQERVTHARQSPRRLIRREM